jgi:hypothetical protein
MTKTDTLPRLLSIRLRRLGPNLLPIPLAAPFIWFGALKITGTSPVEQLVVESVPGVDGSWFVALVGLSLDRGSDRHEQEPAEATRTAA